MKANDHQREIVISKGKQLQIQVESDLDFKVVFYDQFYFRLCDGRGSDCFRLSIDFRSSFPAFMTLRLRSLSGGSCNRRGLETADQRLGEGQAIVNPGPLQRL